MKILIIFFGIFILNISLLTFQSDFNRFNIIQENLKNIVDEAASSVAIYFEEEEYSLGYLVSNQVEAIEHLEFIIADIKKKNKMVNIEKIDYYLYFFDQSNKVYTYKNGVLLLENEISMPYFFIDENNRYILIKEPSVILNLTINVKDIFRLPFVKQEQISRSSKYEMKARGNKF